MISDEQRMKLNVEMADFAKRGDLENVMATVMLGAEPDFGHSRALRCAAQEGFAPVIEYLVDAGANLHALNNDALRQAVNNGRYQAVGALIKLGADVNAQDGEFLIKAADRGDADIVRDLLIAKADPHRSDDQALRKAAFNGHAPVVRLLLKFGADPFAMHGSAMALANADKHGEVVEALAEVMNEQREEFRLTLALQETTQKFLRAPYQNSGESALIRAVKMNNLDKVIEKMKACGDTFSFADMHELKDRSGRSVAVLAAETGQLGKLFDPEFWKSDVEGLKAAWNKIPAPTQKSSGVTQDSFAALVASHHQNILKAGANRFKLKPPGL